MLNVIKTRQLKEQIKKEPHRVKEIIDAETELGICVTDPKGYYKLVNDRYADIYGYNKFEFFGKHFTMVVPKEQHGDLQDKHDQFIQNEYEILRNWVVVRKNGQKINIQADAGFFNTILDKKPHKVTFVFSSDI